eukprot:4227750-Prorocentrum_lima.AAC.1
MTAKLADGVVERVMQHTGQLLAEVAPPGCDKDAGVVEAMRQVRQAAKASGAEVAKFAAETH